MSDSPRARGLFSSLRNLFATSVATARTRLELLSTELEEERARVLGLLVWGGAALILLAAGTVFTAVFLTVLLWDSHRLLALGVFSAVFLGAGAVALASALRLANGGSRLFAASLAELSQDQAALEPRE